MHDLVYALKRLAEQHREGSFATQANRKHMLMLFGEQLVASGYTQLTVSELKGRHINRLLALWRDSHRASAEVHRLALGHVAAIDRKIAELDSIRRTLVDLTRRCHGDDRPDCPIIDELAGGGD